MEERRVLCSLLSAERVCKKSKIRLLALMMEEGSLAGLDAIPGYDMLGWLAALGGADHTGFQTATDSPKVHGCLCEFESRGNKDIRSLQQDDPDKTFATPN